MADDFGGGNPSNCPVDGGGFFFTNVTGVQVDTPQEDLAQGEARADGLLVSFRAKSGPARRTAHTVHS